MASKNEDMNRLSILLILMIIPTMIYARKEGNTVTGKVTDNEQRAVASANVVLVEGQDKLVKAALTDEQGVFVLENIPAGEYVLKVTMLGYETYSSGKIAVAGNTVVPDITVTAKSTTLNEVAVRAQKPFIEVKADKIIVNVENSIISAGSSAMEVLQRSPGVMVDNNDNISLKGKQGVMIWMNGKQTPMSGQDLANVLKSMPANSIDRIEIISNPGARYDAAGSAGIINIITKKDQRLGVNGSVNLSYGQGVYPKYSGGASLNYRNKKLTAFVSYNYAKRIWFNHLMLNRQFLDTNDQQTSRLDQDNNAVFDFKNHMANAGLDYTLSSKTTIGISVSGITNSFSPKADNKSNRRFANDEIEYWFFTTGRHENAYYNYAGNGYMRHVFDTTGKELAIDLDYAAFGNQSNQNFTTIYRNPNGTENRPDEALSSDLTGLTQIRSVKADLTLPLEKKLRVETGVKSSYVTADNEPIFYVNNSTTPDPLRTNHFIYNENINAAYLNTNKEWEQFGVQVGLRLENTNIKLEQRAINQPSTNTYSYTQLFPSFAVQYHMTPIHDIGVTLSRRIERPNYQQLNPFRHYIDATTYREGYPYLNPASFYSVELSHTYKQRFLTTITYGINKGIITEVIQPSDNEKNVTVQTNKNLDRMLFVGLSGAYPFQVTKWWNNVTNYNIYYARYEGNIANTPLNNGRPTFDFNTTNTFILPRNFSAELGGFYQARQIYGYMDVQPVWMLNMGVQKNFLDKRATLRLNVQDLFWTGYPSATSVFTGYKESFTAERETRQVTVAFTYRFGKKTVAPTRRRSGGAEEEKRRAGTGGA